MLSAIVITRNEEQMIRDCLISLGFVDELIVVDTGNSDATNQISEEFRAKIVKSGGDDYSQFRNAGLKKATGDWVIYIDADERVSPLLRQEILQLISQNPTANAFALLRKNYYLGRHMTHGGWGDDFVIRLFKRKHLTGYKNPLHEQPVFTGELQKLTQPLIHLSHRDLTSMTEKTLAYTKYEAELRFSAHHPQIVVWRFIRVMATEFWFRFIRLSAWKDGPEGVIDGLFQIFNTFIIYARLWELQLHEKSHRH